MKKVLSLCVSLILCCVLFGCTNKTTTVSINKEEISKITLGNLIIDESEHHYFIEKLNNLKMTSDKDNWKENFKDIYIEEISIIHAFYIYENGRIIYSNNRNVNRYYCENITLVHELLTRINELE